MFDAKRSMVSLFVPVFILAVSVATGVAQAQRSRGAYTDVRGLPDSPAGKRITELLEVVNSGDPARVEKFVNEAFTPQFRDFAPMEEHLAVFADVHAQSRELEFYGIRKYEQETSENEVVAILRNKLTDAWEAFVMNLEPSPPHRIAGLRFAPARPPSDLGPQEKLSEREIVEQLEAHIKKLADADAFSGTYLLAKNGKVLCKGAHGLASKRFNVPNRIDTKFNLGSMNKMFTGVAVAQLVQRGKLSFEDPLSKFLSTDWLPRDVSDKVTVHHLLTHTSGLGSYFTEKFMNSSRALYREVDDYKPIVAEETLAFEPGTDWQYSNTGMLLAGAVIEKVAGQSYFDYVRQNIYAPAGMTNTDCYEMDRPVPNLAIGYSKERDGDRTYWTNNIFKHVVKGGPAGGGFSTVEDLLKFDRALRSHKLLNPKYTEIVLTGKPDRNSPDYGYGFAVRGEPGARIVGHGGGFPGINSNLDMFLDSGYTAVVMSNYDRGAHPIMTKIRELVSRAKE